MRFLNKILKIGLIFAVNTFNPSWGMQEVEQEASNKKFQEIVIALLDSSLPNPIDQAEDLSHEQHKTVCWVCFNSIAQNQLAKLSCGHSAYHQDCVEKITVHMACPICLKPQINLIKAN